MNEKTNFLNGFMIINKPAGITSHDVVARVRRLIKVGLPAEALAKVGHAGTLDPIATGVLLVAIGNSTRLLEYVKDLPKTYQAEITLGATSDTDDLTGKIQATSPSPASVTGGDSPGVGAVQQVLQSFLGPIQQIPPTYAAIKVRGKKLYEYARAGESVERKSRSVTIFSLKLLSYTYPLLSLEIECSSGTYIRALGRDIGEKLATGAYVSHLARISIHKFHITQALSLEKLSTVTLTSFLLPPEKLVEHLPKITLSPTDVAKFVRGQTIVLTEAQPAELAGKPIAIFEKESGKLVGIGQISSHTPPLLWPKKVF